MVNNKGYFETYKTGLLPWVKDWTDPQDHMRYETNIKKMRLIDWIFCHPQGFNLINYGQHILTAFWLTPIAFLLWDRVRVLSVLCWILLFFNARTFGKKIKLRKLYTSTTYYDIYMKEDKLDLVVGKYD